MLRYLFFDFGGCIDAPGIHTRTLFWKAFVHKLGLSEAEKASFQEAYSRADSKMMQTGIAKNLGLREFNRLNGALISEFMGLNESSVIVACDDVTFAMKKYIAESRSALTEIAKEWPLGLISNFTGNLEVILSEHQLTSLFHSVTESYYVGVSKPDPKIFEAALAKQEFRPENCLYVGDNPVNDIAPAKRMGMKAVLIHEPGKRRECEADGYITNLGELASWIRQK